MSSSRHRWVAVAGDGGRLFVRCFGGSGTVRENVAGHVLASLTTMQWNAPSKAWTGGSAMADASLDRRMTVRLGSGVAFGDRHGRSGGPIAFVALRLYVLP